MNGLVLIGGKSSRMGTDKSLLHYHGKSQREYLYDLAKKFCSEVYYSCRSGQQFSTNTIIDSYPIESPLNGILSAFKHTPESAWLVVACDMPFINAETLDILIQHRNPAKLATAFLNPETNAPDPLLTIYEPQAYPLLLDFVAAGNKSPKKFLQNNPIQLITSDNSEFLKNINTTEEFENIKLSQFNIPKE